MKAKKAESRSATVPLFQPEHRKLNATADKLAEALGYQYTWRMVSPLT